MKVLAKTGEIKRTATSVGLFFRLILPDFTDTRYKAAFFLVNYSWDKLIQFRLK